MTEKAEEHSMIDCVVRSSARPTLYTPPAPLYPDTDPEGFHGMLAVHMMEKPELCAALIEFFPQHLMPLFYQDSPQDRVIRLV